LESIEHGKFWRDGKGRIRQDDQHGLSVLLDIREPNQKIIVDNRLKVVNVGEWPENLHRESASGRVISQQEQELRRNADGRIEYTKGFGSIPTSDRRGDLEVEIAVLAEALRVPLHIEKTSVEGMGVTVYKLPYGEGTAEWWVASDLKFVLASRYVTETAEFEQRYHNIRLEKVPESIFRLPVEYPIRTVNWQQIYAGGPLVACGAALRITDGLTGQRSRKDGIARTLKECHPGKEPLAGSPDRATPRQPLEAAAIPATAGGIRVDASVTVAERPLAGLRAEDFIVTEDRRRRSATALARESLPLDVVLVLPRYTKRTEPDYNQLWRRRCN
jgi:hypothetical protein